MNARCYSAVTPTYPLIRAYSPRVIQAAAFSAISNVGALVLSLVIIGITPGE